MCTVPDEYCNSDVATDLECITYVQMGGQLIPIESKDGKRKKPDGPVRQRVEYLGGLRCVISERDDGSEETPLMIVVLAHGIHVMSDDLYGLAYHLARRRVRFVLPGGLEESSEYKDRDPRGEDVPPRAPRQWFAWSEKDTPTTLRPRLEAAARQLAACAAAAHAQAPDATLVVGGFSQGAAASLQAVVATPALKPAALVQLSAQAPLCEMPPGSLDGVRLLAAAGTSDPIAPISMSETLISACTAAGAEAAPLLTYDGAHEVTLDVVHEVGKLLDGLLAKGEPAAAPTAEPAVEVA